jgi:hypothetical protein
MTSKTLPGTHILNDGSHVAVTVSGRMAELRGTSPTGEPTFTLQMPTERAVELLSGRVDG